MSDGMTFVQNEDGAFSAYDDSYDVVIHCETEEEQKKVIERLKAKNWIPVSERLPEEYDSIFAKFKGTDNWKRGMFEKTSKYVIATVIFDDGAVLVEQAHTHGIWRTDNEVLGGTAVAWMEYPEPYKED